MSREGRKRKLNFKHHYQFQSVRPQKVLQAARYLVNNSQLFKNEGIQVSDNWLENLQSNENENMREFLASGDEQNQNDLSGPENDDINSTLNEASNTSNSASESSNSNDNDDNWTEFEEPPAGILDTLLQEPDIAVNGDIIISFAP